MTVADAIRAATERLAATSDTARLDAELLMAHALGVSRSEMLLRHMRDPAPESFAILVERRSAHEPIAYITGVQDFYGREFIVSPDVLIPRGDSETLIEVALDVAAHPERVLDLGAGSGALFVTALLELDGEGVAVDASSAAVRVATRNAARLGLSGERVRILERDWHNAGWADDLGTFDLILCNPPYVEDDAQLDPDVRDFEPATALFAGKEGLDDYRALIPQLRKVMNEDSVAIFEIGAAQAESVANIAENAGFSVEIRNDLANRPRCAILR